jgi:glycosyltransferase involved in cell wall biosynthesis
MPIKITHLITELSYGGAQKVLINLLSNIDKEKYKCSVVCFYNGESPVAQDIRDLSIEVIDLKMTNKFRVDALYRLSSILKSQKPNILHSWMFHPVLAGRIFGCLHKIPVIISSRHNVNIGGLFREMINRLTAQMDDHVIAVCEVARQTEIKRAHILPDKVTTIYNGINLEEYLTILRSRDEIRKYLGVTNEDFVVVSTGRMHYQKGYSILINAISLITNTYPSIKLLLVGDGPVRSILEKYALELGISNQIMFTGQRSDISDILHASDVYISSSLWEGSSISIIEAMASGLPIIATKVGGTPELVEDKVSGILVPSRNPSIIAQAIIELYTNAELRKNIGIQARQRAIKNFSSKEMVKKIEKLYLKLLKEKN